MKIKIKLVAGCLAALMAIGAAGCGTEDNSSSAPQEENSKISAESEEMSSKDENSSWTAPETTEIGIWYSTWYAKTADYSEKNYINTWTAWNIDAEPLMPDGTFATYDALDEKVLMFHLREMAKIGIDFIIMDQTNHIDVDGGYINDRSIKMAETIKKFNDNPENKHKIKYCSGIGGIQWDYDKVGYAAIEDEAKILYQRYIEDRGLGSPDYHYYVDGKPLMVVYFGNRDPKGWGKYKGDKTFADKFTVGAANNDCVPGYYGWAYNKGTKWDDETVVVMPGWDNRKGAPAVPRESGDWYKKSWDVVLKAPKKPRRIIINSFNEYAECTAVFPANTELPRFPYEQSFIDKNGEYDPYMYWNMTKDFIKKFKAQDKPLAKPY